MNTIHLSVKNEFSRTPGARSRNEGEFSGEEFLEGLLLPKFKQALLENALLSVDLDGTSGYATSFLESAFGGLTRRYNPDTVLKHLRFVCHEEPYLSEDIKHYISEAQVA